MASFKRDPAVLAGILVATVQALTAFLLADNSAVQALVNAVAIAIAAAVVAVAVRSDNQLPLLTGAAQAVVALMVGVGFDWEPTQQAALLAPIALIAGYIVRDRVTAPVPAPPVSSSPVS